MNLKTIIRLSTPLFVFLAVTGWLLSSNKLKSKHIYNEGLRFKMETLLDSRPNPSIVILGDSRAREQISPKILEKVTGWPTINLGVLGGITASAPAVLNKIFKIDDKGICILSPSSSEINDNAKLLSGYSVDGLKYMSIFQRFDLFGKDIKKLITSEIKLQREPLKLMLSELLEPGKTQRPKDPRLGFVPLKAEVAHFSYDPFSPKSMHMYGYTKPLLNKHRRAVFAKAIRELSFYKNISFILLIPPVTGAWHHYAPKHGVDKIEEAFSKELIKEASKYKNFTVLNLRSELKNRFQDFHFSDNMHLSEPGAHIYSNYIANYLQSIKK